VLAQVRSTADQVSVVVQAVFWFSLAAGVLVLSFYSQPLLDYLTRIASGLV